MHREVVQRVDANPKFIMNPKSRLCAMMPPSFALRLELTLITARLAQWLPQSGKDPPGADNIEATDLTREPERDVLPRTEQLWRSSRAVPQQMSSMVGDDRRCV
jgi:hypothetical protein